MKTLGIFTKVVLFVCLSAFAWSQAVTQIQGTVQDSTGSAVPGASIKATQTETGVSRAATSGADGAYILTNLPLGPYSLEVTKEGFTKHVQTGITLQVNVAPTVDIALKVGSVNESVQVEANANLVETQATGVGTVIENQRILELPLNGRQATDLIQLAGAAVPQGAASSRSMNGGQAFGVSYQLDGGLHNNPFDNLNLPLPFPDALQEFKVETSSLTAQNGMHSAAAVNAVTKSGTNEIHGDAFEFLRNGAANGHPYFSKIADNLKRNQYGGTIGGALRKNKLFAFGGYQATKTRQFTPDNVSFVPTAAMLNGDFTACSTIGGTVNPATFSKAAVEITKRLGVTSTDPCGRISFGIPNSVNEWQSVGRMDYQLSDKQTLFGRYIATTYYQTPPYYLDPNILNTTQGGRDNLAQTFTFGDTYLISPTMVNSFRLALNRTAIHRSNADFFSAPEVGVKAFSYMPHYMLLNITNGFTLGGGTENEATFRTTTYQLGDDVSIVKGSHQIAFGVTLNQWRSNGYANVRSPGSYTVSGGLRAFLQGQLNGAAASFLQSGPNTLLARAWYFGSYIQDTWKVSSKLTLNYGVRWEPWFPMQLTNSAIYNFDSGRFDAGERSSIFRNAPAGFRFPGDSGFAGQAGMDKKWGNFGPRVGLAFDPKGDGRLVIRASYGLAYDYVNGQFYINTANAPPWGSEVRITGTRSLDDPFGSDVTNIFPISFNQNAPFSLSGPFIALKPNTKNTGVHSWNLTIQKQLGAAWLLSASYIGNQTQHLWVSTQANPGVYVPGQCVAGQYGLTAPGACSTANNLQARRLLTLRGNPDARYIGFLDQFDDGGTQSYNGLLLSMQKRLSHHYSLNANYTWSHCIGDFTQGGQTPNVGTGFTDPNNRRRDRGPCSGSTNTSSDRRHLFNFTAVAETPRFANNTTRMIASGWRISGIYRFVSGQPLNVTLAGTAQDVLLSGTTAQRPNLIGDPYCTERTNACWIQTAAFQPIATNPATCAANNPCMPLGTFGNLGRFALVGPAFWQIDTAVSRVFKTFEKQSLEVRAEAFNVTNSLRAGNPTTGFPNNLFGQITQTFSGAGVNDSRVLQFAMKYVF